MDFGLSMEDVEQMARAGLAAGVAAAVALAVHAIAFWILARLARRTDIGADDALVRRCREPARLALPLLAALLAVPASAEAPALLATLRHVVVLTLITAVAWLLLALTRVVDDVVQARFDVTVKDNLRARQMHTRMRVLRRTVGVIIIIVALAAMLMTFPAMRQLGAGILASAGIAGLVVGMAARPLLSNLIAGVQLALTGTLNLDDVVIVEGEWGRIEEITSTYVVVRIWDLRRLVVPITYFAENPVQNWTRTTADLLATASVFVDYTTPVDEVRAQLKRILDESPHWDGKVWGMQVVNATDRTIELRALMSAADSSEAWNLRCEVREKLVAFLRDAMPGRLPTLRAEVREEGDRAQANAAAE